VRGTLATGVDSQVDSHSSVEQLVECLDRFAASLRRRVRVVLHRHALVREPQHLLGGVEVDVEVGEPRSRSDSPVVYPSRPHLLLTSERLGWQRTFVGPIASLRNSVPAVFSNPYSYPGRFGSLRQVAAIVIPAGGDLRAGADSGRHGVVSPAARVGWATFLGLTALGTSTIYYSVPRMLLSLFPVMLFLAVVTRAHRAI
jgi:hypothetical protein